MASRVVAGRGVKGQNSQMQLPAGRKDFRKDFRKEGGAAVVGPSQLNYWQGYAQ